MDAWKNLAEASLKGHPLSELDRETVDGLARGPIFFDAPAQIFADRVPVPALEGRPWHITPLIEAADAVTANRQALDALMGGASALWLPSANTAKRVLEGVDRDLAPILMEECDPLADRLRSGDPRERRTIVVDAAAVFEAGGTPVDQLTFLAASLIAKGGRAARIRIALEADTHQSIAVMRAAKRLARTVCDALKVDIPPLHVVTARRMMTRTDPWTNLLRTSAATFAAVVGGAEYVTTRPFTDALGHPTDFSARIARNQQLLMMEESHLGAVRDPGHGSHFHESLADDLAGRAWSRTQAMEAKGGLAETLDAFRITVKASAHALMAAPPPLVGISLHPAPPLRESEAAAPRQDPTTDWPLPQIWLESAHD